jgi:hypothetical protein
MGFSFPSLLTVKLLPSQGYFCVSHGGGGGGGGDVMSRWRGALALSGHSGTLLWNGSGISWTSLEHRRVSGGRGCGAKCAAGEPARVPSTDKHTCPGGRPKKRETADRAVGPMTRRDGPCLRSRTQSPLLVGASLRPASSHFHQPGWSPCLRIGQSGDPWRRGGVPRLSVFTSCFL